MTIQHEYADIPPLTLGWRIQMALAHGQLKHADLMAKFEVSRETVSRWCHDASKPKKFILNEIAVMAGVSPRWLIDGTDHPHNPDGDGPGNAKPTDLRALNPLAGPTIELRLAG
jgi:transcriptional regulator with XRE-family HTH domain